MEWKMTMEKLNAIKELNRIVKEHLNPPLFEKGKTQEDFWDNEHISKMMLMAHLNPNWDAASRKPATIKGTCQWLSLIHI